MVNFSDRFNELFGDQNGGLEETELEQLKFEIKVKNEALVRIKVIIEALEINVKHMTNELRFARSELLAGRSNSAVKIIENLIEVSGY